MGLTITGRQKPLSFAVRSHLLVTLGLVSLGYGAMASADTTKWACHADANGTWACTEYTVTGKSFQRPKHRLAKPASTPEEPRINTAHNLDWVPKEQLTADEKALVKGKCCGAYIEPPQDYPDAELDPSDAPIRLSADTTEAQGSVATLKGDVQVSQGYRRVRSDQATVDQEKREVVLDGDINFREPGLLLTGEHATINMDKGELDIKDAKFVLHDSGAHGGALSFTRREDGIIYIDNATYTTCEPDNNTWLLQSSDVAIDRARNHVTAKNVILKVKDWPVLYVPWVRFPASDERASGLLFPSLEAGNDNGLDFAQPIYLNLAPQYDATITPRYIQERGAMLEGEFRHLASWSQTTVAGSFLASDDGGDKAADSTTGKRRYEGEDRWSTNVEHEGIFRDNWTSFIDFTDVSDEDYFRDLDVATLEVNSQSHLNQELKGAYQSRHWEVSAKAQQFETLIRDGLDQYKQLPRVDANGFYRFDNTDLVLTLKQHYVIFDHSDDNRIYSPEEIAEGPERLSRIIDDEGTIVTGSRLRADYALSWDKQWLWGFFKPSAKIKYLSYDLDNPLQGSTDDSPNALVPVVSIDSGLFFERSTTWFNNGIQTVEPRLFYLNAKHEDQSAMPDFDTSELTFSYDQLFRDDRFSGGDRIGDTEQFTLGLTTRLLDATTGIERMRASVGQIFYMDDRLVSLNPLLADKLIQDESNIAAEFGALIGQNLRFQSDVLFDDNNGKLDKSSVGFRYKNDGTILNFAYRFTRQDDIIIQTSPSNFETFEANIDQVDLSFSLPVSDSWQVLGRWNQDLNSSQELEVFAGLEYSSCCWSTSIIARRWIDRDDTLLFGVNELDHQSGIFFQIQFKGLAGTGRRVSNILEDGIYGYRATEN